MPRSLAAALLATTIALAAAPAASAQWDPGATAMLGAGHGFTALSQSVMSNAFGTTGGSGGSGDRRPEAEPKPRKATARQLRKLRFAPDPARTTANAPAIRELLLATCPPDREGCPTNHAELVDQGIATGDHRIRFRDNLRTLVRGTDRNVADAVAGFVVIAWAAQQPTLELTGEQKRGARRITAEVRNQMALDAPTRRLSAARKQELVEALGAIAQHGLAMRHAYQGIGATEQADDLTRYLRDVARDLSSVDVAEVRLRRTGFVAR